LVFERIQDRIGEQRRLADGGQIDPPDSVDRGVD